MKRFYIKIYTGVSLPYEESLLDGKVNKTHLMYLAQAEIDKLPPMESHSMAYEFIIQEGGKEDIKL